MKPIRLATHGGLLLASVFLTTAALAGPATGEPALAIRPTAPEVQWGPCPPLFAKGCEIAVLHGNPAEPNADIWLRIPAGFHLPAHTHTSNERMVLSTGELEVRYANQRKVVLKKGDYAFGPSKHPHEARCIGKNPCTLFIAFEGPVDALPYEGKLP
jgi:quercetin dioxygenase-like cupin family protein